MSSKATSTRCVASSCNARPVSSGDHVVAHDAQQLAERRSGVFVVVDQEDALARGRDSPVVRWFSDIAGRGVAERQPEQELAAAAGSTARRGKRPAVQTSQVAGDLQAQTETSLGSMDALRTLDEQFEHAVELAALRPMPSSWTVRRTSSASTSPRTETWPPESVNLEAFVSRFATTWDSRVAYLARAAKWSADQPVSRCASLTIELSNGSSPSLGRERGADDGTVRPLRLVVKGTHVEIANRLRLARRERPIDRGPVARGFRLGAR